ncbi:MAG: glutamate--tRNA ligase [Candidatus Gracilibacteria bacterium]|nr:glutamate--tRNA ligase [Candidatus Gracilibacteria bacterium]
MLANLLFPEIKETPQDIINKYPKRPDGKVITRIAPSPTGFLHIGAIYSAMLDKIVAYKNNGLFFLRIEDTDQKREVEGMAKKYIELLKIFGLNFNEGPIGLNGEDIGNYGPYTQSKREYIYKTFLKDLVLKGLAYPCFLTEEEITQTREIQEASKLPTGIYKEYSPWRYASLEDVKKALDEKKEFVIRLKSSGELIKKIEINDLIKGKVSMQENFLDVVLMKTNGIPTYHFAHLIDDYLMGTTLVIRGDEWFASVPLHLELFKMMLWKAPNYAHYGPLVKIDGDSRRKISKRLDPEADIEYYFEKGFLIEAILDFLSNIINSGFEDWRKENLNKSYLEFDFKLEKINSAGALVDLEKLTFVNATLIKNMPLEELYEKLSKYLQEYENDFYNNKFLKVSKEYNLKIITELKTRLTIFKEYKKLTTFFYNDFDVNQDIIDLLINLKMKIENIDIVKKGLYLALDILSAKKDEFLNIEEIKNIFVEEIKKVEMKNGQVLWPVRVSLSGEEFSPGALELIYILGKQKSIQRIQNILNLI